MNFNVILVSGYSFGKGLSYYYYRAFVDYLGENNVKSVSENRGYSTSLIARIKNKVAHVSGLRSSGKLTDIYNALNDKMLNIVVLFNTSNLNEKNIVQLSLKKNIFLVHVLSDHPMGMLANTKEITINTLKYFDLVITMAKDLVPVLYQWGAKNVLRLPFAYCKYTHWIPEEINCEYPNKLFYFGTWTPDIEEWLSHLTKFDLVIEGTHWQFAKNSILRQLGTKSNLQADRNMAITARKAGIVVNFTRATHGCFHTMKTFELPAAGACVVTNRSEEQVEFFKEDIDCVYFNTPQEMCNKIEYLFNHPEVINTMRESAKATAKDHNYHERVRRLLDEVNSITR
jgi:hypothetical protein